MSLEHTWEVDRIECSREYKDDAVPVCSIHWKLTTKNTEDYIYTATHHGITIVNMSVVDAANLSAEDALQLVLNTLGVEGVQSKENENSIELNNLIVPIIPVITIS